MKVFENTNVQAHLGIKIAGIPSYVLRKGAVEYNPFFGLKNVFRDTGSAIFYSKHGYNPFDFARGSRSVINKDQYFQKFLAYGTSQSFMIGMDSHLGFNTNPQMVNSYHHNKRFQPFKIHSL